MVPRFFPVQAHSFNYEENVALTSKNIGGKAISTIFAKMNWLCWRVISMAGSKALFQGVLGEIRSTYTGLAGMIVVRAIKPCTAQNSEMYSPFLLLDVFSECQISIIRLFGIGFLILF